MLLWLSVVTHGLFRRFVQDKYGGTNRLVANASHFPCMGLCVLLLSWQQQTGDTCLQAPMFEFKPHMACVC